MTPSCMREESTQLVEPAKRSAGLNSRLEQMCSVFEVMAGIVIIVYKCASIWQHIMVLLKL